MCFKVIHDLYGKRRKTRETTSEKYRGIITLQLKILKSISYPKVENPFYSPLLAGGGCGVVSICYCERCMAYWHLRRLRTAADQINICSDTEHSSTSPGRGQGQGRDQGGDKTQTWQPGPALLHPTSDNLTSVT